MVEDKLPKYRHRTKPSSIALIANQNEILYRLRMPWIRKLREEGYKVYAVAPSGKWSQLITNGGAEFIEWKLSRSGLNPISEFRSILDLTKILRRIKPDIVQNFHTKPNIYAPIAAKLSRTPLSISTVTGLGYTFVERPGIRARINKYLNLRMYALSNRLTKEVTFQNRDDMELLRAAKGLPRGKGCFIPGGSGVDISEYKPGTIKSQPAQELRKSLGISPQSFVVMFVGRLQLDKGLIEFVNAARILKNRRGEITFVMVGAPDPGNKRSLTKSMLKQWQSEGNVIFTGRREDVPDLMAIANAVAAPTFYREGLPRTLLEASASGLPLIGTDMPGVREVIKHGVNGILIPAKNSTALVNAITELVDDREKAQKYGKASLNRAVIEFDYKKVVGAYIKKYNDLWNNL